MPNPSTPIPPRSSAATAYNRPTRRTEDLREQPPAIWQYESPNFEVASTLSSLSLLAPEAPTQPQPPLSPRQTRRLPAIDEIDTVPPISPAVPRVAGPLALPAPQHLSPAAVRKSTPQSIVPAGQASVVEQQDGGSWTAGAASNSSYAQLIATSPARDWRKQLAFNPLDRLRWWLLRPGRIEFMFWLSGTLLLILVTGVLLFMLAFSFQVTGGVAGREGGPAKTAQSGGKATAQAQRHGTLSSLQVTLTPSGPFAPGNSVGVRGQGFSLNKPVSFMLDGVTPILDQHGNKAIALTDAKGTFRETLWLSVGPGWSAGHHDIVVRDIATGRSAVLQIVLMATVNGTSASPTVPATVSTPGVTPTALPAAPTPPVHVTPVNKTPVPVSPTPTPTHTPTATPTAGKTPTPTSTATPKPTAATTPPAAPGTTPAASPQANNTSFGNALNQSGEPPIGTPLSTASPLVWIMAACYSLSMILLGVAGILYKRRPRAVKSISAH